MSIESIIPQIIENNPKRYFSQEEIPNDNTETIIDPLSRIVPCFTDLRDFFGPFVCNLIVFTRVYLNGSSDFDNQLVQTKQQLKNTYSKFARYETHIWIDGEADGIASASGSDLITFSSRLFDLCQEMAAYGFTYHDQLGGDQLKASIDEVIKAFNMAVTS